MSSTALSARLHLSAVCCVYSTCLVFVIQVDSVIFPVAGLLFYWIFARKTAAKAQFASNYSPLVAAEVGRTNTDNLEQCPEVLGVPVNDSETCALM